MANKLQNYFPIIRSREEILEIIRERENLKLLFTSWSSARQNEFLDFCSGTRGVKMLYDAFAKELLNPETAPERLEELLSLLLGLEVKILHVLPNDNSRLAEESSLLTMDIVVKLENGSIANIELQKIGYAFPGQRSACYSADLLLRQYKQVRSRKTRESFSYQDVKNVYTIVFLEKSGSNFHQFPDVYLHYFQQQSNTGLTLEHLQKFIYIPLDIFLNRRHNKIIRNPLEAWLTFLGSDDPEDMIAVMEAYPQFKAMYRQVYEICRNVEDVMGIFSEELRMLDRNTIRYMMDEMQHEIDQKKILLKQQDMQISEKNAQLSRQNAQINQQSAQIDQQSAQIDQQSAQIDQQSAQIDQQSAQINQQSAQINQQSAQINQQKKLLAEKEELLHQALKLIEQLEGK